MIQCTFEPGDMIVTYTDGVTEAMNREAGTVFGTSPAAKRWRRLAGRAVEDTVECNCRFGEGSMRPARPSPTTSPCSPCERS